MVGCPVRDAVPEPRTDLGADFAGFAIFPPGLVLQLHRTESLQFFFLSNVSVSSLPSCQGGFVSSCYNEHNERNGDHARRYTDSSFRESESTQTTLSVFCSTAKLGSPLGPVPVWSSDCRTPTYTHKHAVVTRRPTQTTPGESRTLFCLT